MARLPVPGLSILIPRFTDEDVEGVNWAYDYIVGHASIAFPLEVEKRLSLIGEDFKEVYGGTPDAVAGFEFFDFKWRERDYIAQMAAYALIILSENDFEYVRAHVLFGDSQKAVVYQFTREEAYLIVSRVVRKATAPDREPTPCDYCGWCARKLTCSALNERAQAVAAGREDWKLEQYHSSAITSPVEMAKALRLARFLKKWCEAVEFHAKQMAIVRGEQIPGTHVAAKSGKQFCSAVGQAYELAGLAPREFLAACDLRLNTSKKYPDRKGLIDIYAAAKGIKKAAAKRELLKKLEPVLSRSNPSQSIKFDAEPEEDEGETVDV
jgi:hypothetical protein